MKKIFIITAAALLALTGCVKDEVFKGPTKIEKVVYTPEAPTSNDQVTVTVTVSGLQAVTTATLYYGNAAVPMNYTVFSEGGENIVSVSVDGSETAYTDHSRGTMPVKNGCAEIRYHGNIPVISSIVIYLSAGAILLVLTAFIAIKLIKPKKRRYADPLNNPDEVYDTEEIEAQEPETPSEDVEVPAKDIKTSLAQTTTFSIFELNALSRNKKYVDEINKDIEERIQADSIRDQKNDIRARELEEMSRKVYGEQSGTEQSEADSPAQAESTAAQLSQDTAPQSDTEDTGDSTDD